MTDSQGEMTNNQEIVNYQFVNCKLYSYLCAKDSKV